VGGTKIHSNFSFQKISRKKKIILFYFYVQRVLRVYCLQFYIHLGPKSPLNKTQIMEDKLSSCIGKMPQTWLGDCVRSLHDLNNSVSVGEGQG